MMEIHRKNTDTSEKNCKGRTPQDDLEYNIDKGIRIFANQNLSFITVNCMGYYAIFIMHKNYRDRNAVLKQNL